MSNRISLEDCIKRIYEKHNGKIDIIEYNFGHNKSKFRCSVCQYVWYAKTSSVWVGSGCPVCADLKRRKDYQLDMADVIKIIESKNCFLVSTVYNNTKEKLKILFECGHIYPMALDCFQRGQRCPCSSQFRIKHTIEKKTRKKIEDTMSNLGFEIISISGDIVSWDSLITYRCKIGHIQEQPFRSMSRKGRGFCKECLKINSSESQTGSKGNNWQGGKTKIRIFLKKSLTEWKKDSMKNCNYKCVITGDRFDDIHHLYPFNKILSEALVNLNLEYFEFIGNYSEETMIQIENEVIRLHYIYPLGVCLRKDIHQLFHKLYGNKNVTIDDFYEFKSKFC